MRPSRGSRRPSNGENPEAATRLDARQGAHSLPQFLPDGRHFLYWAISGHEPNGMFVGQLDGSGTRRLLDADFDAVYAPQRQLLFVRQGTLFAQPFDPDQLALTGPTSPVAEQIMASTTRTSAAISASAAGPIAYRTGSARRAQKQLAWFDRSGRELAKVGGPYDSSQLSPSLSPDGRQVAFFRLANGNVDIWQLDVARGVPTRFTFDSADDVLPLAGQFSPDGKWIAYVSIKSGRYEVYVQPFARRGGREVRISSDGGGQVRWGASGKALFFIARDGRLVAVPIRFGPNGESVEAGAPVPLFAAHVGGWASVAPGPQYVVSPDGQRFLMNTAAEEAVTSPITVILNWKPKL